MSAHKNVKTINTNNSPYAIERKLIFLTLLLQVFEYCLFKSSIIKSLLIFL